MKLKNNKLWVRLKQYQFDDIESEIPFSVLLANENKWTQKFSASVIKEYKKFVFLMVTTKGPLTPSDEVDQVWHLHMRFSEEYWKNFCALVVEKELDHGPTKGGVSEDEKFTEWYSNTLNNYKQVFKTSPPGKIWPTPRARFKHAAFFRRVDSKKYFLFKKPDFLGIFSLLFKIWVASLLVLIMVMFVYTKHPVVAVILGLLVIRVWFRFYRMRQEDRKNKQTGRFKGLKLFLAYIGSALLGGTLLSLIVSNSGLLAALLIFVGSLFSSVAISFNSVEYKAPDHNCSKSSGDSGGGCGGNSGGSDTGGSSGCGGGGGGCGGGGC